jgi:phage nucleotide-binding protein
MTATATATGPKVVITPAKGGAPSLAEKVAKMMVPASTIPDEWGLNMILFGSPGVGKTTLAASAQDSKYGRNVLFIDVEGGTRSIADRTDVQVVRPANFGEVRDIFDWIMTEEHSFQTFVIDTIVELQQLGMKDIMLTAKDPEWPGLQEWGKSSDQITRLVRAFRGLAQTKGWNVIFTAHASEQKDEAEGRIYVRPNLTPKVTERICGAVDVVGYMTKEDDGTRKLQLGPTRRVMSKYRQPLSGRRLPDVILNPSLVTILEHLKGGAPIEN